MSRITALDGLRAVALLMVIAYHFDRERVPAGFWGVMVFFVLTGYLITRLLCEEKDRTGRIDLRAFYLKRAFRLHPGLILMSVVLVVFGLHWTRIWPALVGWANYSRVAGADLGVLTHTWFLAVVIHFYLLWPLAIRAIPSHRRVQVIGGLLAVAVAWRAIAIPVMGPSWVYNATDANAAALLAGCFLGVTRPRMWPHTGWAIPLMLALMFLPFFGEQGPAFLWGGFLAIGLGVVAVGHATADPKWLGSPPMVWMGEVSYGLYLWHYVFVTVGVPVVATIALTIILATASYYYVEEPAQKWLTSLEMWRRSPDRPGDAGHRPLETTDRPAAGHTTR